MPDDGSRDDRLTTVAVAALACIVQDILHEAVGHGVTAWLSGARQLTLSTVALQSDISTRWIAADGTLVNLASAVIFWLLLRGGQRYRPATRYFLVLTLAGSLFTGTGYFLYSGFSNFGDWAVVIQGWQPHWVWRLGLIALGIVSYYASMLVVAVELKPFRERSHPRRMQGLCWIPYFADGVLAAIAGLLNPAGLVYVLLSALPSTLGANAGLLALPSMLRRPPGEAGVPAIRRSIGWIAAGAVASLLFVVLIGRGLTWSR
jgi:hypothetical protein